MLILLRNIKTNTTMSNSIEVVVDKNKVCRPLAIGPVSSKMYCHVPNGILFEGKMVMEIEGRYIKMDINVSETVMVLSKRCDSRTDSYQSTCIVVELKTKTHTMRKNDSFLGFVNGKHPVFLCDSPGVLHKPIINVVNKEGHTERYCSLDIGSSKVEITDCVGTPFFVARIGPFFAPSLCFFRFDCCTDAAPIQVRTDNCSWKSKLVYMGEGKLFLVYEYLSNDDYFYDLLETPIVRQNGKSNDNILKRMNPAPVGNGIDCMVALECIPLNQGIMFSKEHNNKFNNLFMSARFMHKGVHPVRRVGNKFFLDKNPHRKAVGRNISIRMENSDEVKTRVDILDDGTMYDRGDFCKCLGRIIGVKETILKKGRAPLNVKLILTMQKEVLSKQKLKVMTREIMFADKNDKIKFDAALWNVPKLNKRFDLIQTILLHPETNVLKVHVPKHIASLIGFYL
jgi:hypothetical protein